MMKQTIRVTVICVVVLLTAWLPIKAQSEDRDYWVDLVYRISAPVLEPMSKGGLKQAMNVELSPTWDNRNKDVAYMEAFGRLMAGIAPWLALPDDATAEGNKRKQLREWALKSYAHAVDPDSPDYLLWLGGTAQPTSTKRII